MKSKSLKVIHYRKWGFELRKQEVRMKGNPTVEVWSAYTPSGDYIGDPRTAWRLCVKRGIAPEKADSTHSVCSIGYSKKLKKWFGWSHRAIFGFKVGSIVKKGDCCASSGWTPEYLAEHPREDKSLPVGFKAKTLEDAKRMAISFADSVS